MTAFPSPKVPPHLAGEAAYKHLTPPLARPFEVKGPSPLFRDQCDELICHLAHHNWKIDDVPLACVYALYANPSRVTALDLSDIVESEGWIQKAFLIHQRFPNAQIRPEFVGDEVRKIDEELAPADSARRQSPLARAIPFYTKERYCEKAPKLHSLFVEGDCATHADAEYMAAKTTKSRRVFNPADHNTNITIVASKELKSQTIDFVSIDILPELRMMFNAHFEARLELLHSLALACFNTYPNSLRKLSSRHPLLLLVNRTPGWQTHMAGRGLEASHSGVVTGVDVTMDIAFLRSKDGGNFLKELRENEGFKKEIEESFAPFKWNVEELIKKRNYGEINQVIVDKKFPPSALLPIETDLRLALASTVELPSYMNKFDVILEDSCRTRVMELLNECFRGEIAPGEVLILFEESMRNFFISNAKNVSEKESLLKKLQLHFEHLKAIGNSTEAPDFNTIMSHLQSIHLLVNKIEKLKSEKPIKTLSIESDALLESIKTNINVLKNSAMFTSSRDFVADIKLRIPTTRSRPASIELMKKIEEAFVFNVDKSIHLGVPFVIPLKPDLDEEADQAYCEKVLFSQIDRAAIECFGYFASEKVNPDVTSFLPEALTLFKSIDFTRSFAENKGQERLIDLSLSLLESFPHYMGRLGLRIQDLEAVQKKLLTRKHSVNIVR